MKMNLRVGALGKAYSDGEKIISQGEIGDCMYILQQGEVEIVFERPEGDTVLGTLNPGAVFGEMALFTREPRSATVRSKGTSRIMTVDKKGFLKRVHQDPSLAFRILQKMSLRVQKLNDELSRIKT
ncbi:cyclic nucleotide-binding domain-containing protein [candidate division KSB1 bacterium]